ncbi:MAG: TSUP family transporter [Gemmatimonadales bacterium]|nr:TSUP family transporter [Gemmatimonadales bacterium]NIR02939.1 TSUP family transporter [Gemmatimonadales bacterium]
MAGGGSLLTLPILIFLGLPVAVANGTNRFAILVQNIAAVTSFRRQGYGDARTSVAFALTTIPGAIAGAFMAIHIGEELFRAILAGVLALAVTGLLFPTRRKEERGSATKRARALAFLAFFAIGFYGGFIQAGVGFLLMLVLHQLLRIDLVRTNVHKVLIILVFSLPALAVFVATGNVAWTTAAALAAGNASGAIVATRVSVKGGDRPIRIVVALALLLMAVRLVW